jgi:hypothetical protein
MVKARITLAGCRKRSESWTMLRTAGGHQRKRRRRGLFIDRLTHTPNLFFGGAEGDHEIHLRITSAPPKNKKREMEGNWPLL